MNQVEWLEQNLQAAQELAARDQARLEQNPESLSAQLASAGSQGRLADLLQQLHELRSKHAS